jgi:uncharacterized protein (TIGR00251 family)
MRIEVRVTPRATRNAVSGRDVEGRLRMHVTAPPADGQANAAVAAVLAEAFGVGGRSVRLVTGATSRTKLFEIEGDEAELQRRLTALTSEGKAGRRVR